MDGITTMVTIGILFVPSYYALSKIYYRLGNHEARLGNIEGKLDTLNGNMTKKKK